MNILIKSATIVDPGNPDLHMKKRDIQIRNGQIIKIAAKIAASGRPRQIKLDNLHVSKGWVDSSVSFGEPGYEERETISNGLSVAAASGFTDIVLNPNTKPVPDSSGDIVFLKQRAAGHACGLHPLGSLTIGSKGVDLAELYDMKSAGAVGFYDYKKPLGNSNLLKIALQYAQVFKGLVFSFPNDTNISGKGIVNEGAVSTRLGLKGIPAMAEELQVARDLSVLDYAGGRLHIPTVSTGRSLDLIAAAKKRGLDVSCSVPLHNLFFTDSILEGFDSNNKVLPPLRSEADNKKLLKGLHEGVIDFVTTDHSPIDIEEKRVEFDRANYGTIGLESAFGALNKLLNTTSAVSILSRGRARFEIPEPGIKEGELANLALFDPDPVYQFDPSQIRSTSKNSIFIGAELKGKVYGSIARGKAVI